MKELIGVDLDAEVLRDAFALAEVGAKSRVIVALTRLKPVLATKLYVHVNGRSAQPGQHPDSFTRFVRTIHQHFHSNYLYNIFEALQELGLPDSQVVLQAYRSYREQFKSSPKLFDVNEAYSLFALLRQPDVVKDCCDECNTAYFLEPFELALGSATCPCCRMVKRRQEVGPGESRQSVVA
ncbi:FlhC family transcriptional regulator [Duganella vulcania]|uniref:Flagellar transcriptional regulator FlhC n=1 Tax=Duganella vulcania TaxID=2692166 RepID=A0A845GHF3_9BURK|nr:FlhC family transcriptional regulator [Duganella vulcania]MYM92726.1 hypothetical protein [Duganella vulcania]